MGEKIKIKLLKIKTVLLFFKYLTVKLPVEYFHDGDFGSFFSLIDFKASS